MGQFTKLDAVNRILRGAGENPVSSLTDTLVNETLMAETLLDEVNIQEQMVGLHCNTVVDEKTPDGDGYIILPDTLLQVLPWYLPEGGKDSRDLDLTVRGNPPRLYNLLDLTDEFEDPVVIRYTLLLDFEELPTAIQFQITDIAAQLYQMAVQGDRAMNDLLGQMSSLSRARGRAADIRTTRANSFRTGTSLGPKNLRQIPRNWW